MATKAQPLTDAQLRQTRPGPKEYNLADGGGLFLRVKPTGSRSWLFNYFKPFTRTRSNLSIGKYPAVSLASARQCRAEYQSLIAQGIDPKTHREAIQQRLSDAHSSTLERASRVWLAVKRATVTQAHAEDIERSLTLHIFPRLGSVPVHLIGAKDAIAILEPIAARGSLETVKRLCQRLNEIFTHCVNTGVLEHNPLAGIGKAFAPPTKEHMPTLKPDELPDLMRALTRASIRITTRCLIEWQLHTMVRPSEAAGARWQEIDFTRGTWNIPAERMKKKLPHTVPLTPQALALLENMKPISGHLEFIFPADRNPKTHTHEQTANMALKRMGFGGRLVSHGLRSLASTTLNEQGFDPDIIEAALAHRDKNTVRAAYNRAEYIERRRPMMAWWSNHVDSAAFGEVARTRTKHMRVVG
ncbi:MAG: integrase domain-containing protein [Pseudomonadota bacterium]